MSEPYDGPDFKPEVQADDKKPEEALVVPPEGVLEGDPANASAFARDILASVVDEVIRRSKTAPADDDSTDNTDNGQLPTTIDSAPKSDDGQRPAPKSPPPYPGGDPCPFVSGSSPDSSSSLSIGSATTEVINELSQKPGGEHSSSETTLPKSELSGSNISNIHSNSESNVQVPDAKVGRPATAPCALPGAPPGCGPGPGPGPAPAPAPALAARPARSASPLPGERGPAAPVAATGAGPPPPGTPPPATASVTTGEESAPDTNEQLRLADGIKAAPAATDNVAMRSAVATCTPCAGDAGLPTARTGPARLPGHGGLGDALLRPSPASAPAVDAPTRAARDPGGLRRKSSGVATPVPPQPASCDGRVALPALLGSESDLERHTKVIDYETEEEAQLRAELVVQEVLEEVVGAALAQAEREAAGDAVRAVRSLVNAAVDAALARACLSDFSTEFAYGDLLSCVSDVKVAALSSAPAELHETREAVADNAPPPPGAGRSAVAPRPKSPACDEAGAPGAGCGEEGGAPLRACARACDLTRPRPLRRAVREEPSEESAESLVRVVEPDSSSALSLCHMELDYVWPPVPKAISFQDGSTVSMKSFAEAQEDMNPSLGAAIYDLEAQRESESQLDISFSGERKSVSLTLESALDSTFKRSLGDISDELPLITITLDEGENLEINSEVITTEGTGILVPCGSSSTTNKKQNSHEARRVDTSNTGSIKESDKDAFKLLEERVVRSELMETCDSDMGNLLRGNFVSDYDALSPANKTLTSQSTEGVETFPAYIPHSRLHIPHSATHMSPNDCESLSPLTIGNDELEDMASKEIKFTPENYHVKGIADKDELIALSNDENCTLASIHMHENDVKKPFEKREAHLQPEIVTLGKEKLPGPSSAHVLDLTKSISAPACTSLAAEIKKKYFLRSSPLSKEDNKFTEMSSTDVINTLRSSPATEALNLKVEQMEEQPIIKKNSNISGINNNQIVPKSSNLSLIPEHNVCSAPLRDSEQLEDGSEHPMEITEPCTRAVDMSAAVIASEVIMDTVALIEEFPCQSEAEKKMDLSCENIADSLTNGPECEKRKLESPEKSPLQRKLQEENMKIMDPSEIPSNLSPVATEEHQCDSKECIESDNKGKTESKTENVEEQKSSISPSIVVPTIIITDESGNQQKTLESDEQLCQSPLDNFDNQHSLRSSRSVCVIADCDNKSTKEEQAVTPKDVHNSQQHLAEESQSHSSASDLTPDSRSELKTQVSQSIETFAETTSESRATGALAQSPPDAEAQPPVSTEALSELNLSRSIQLLQQAREAGGASAARDRSPSRATSGRLPPSARGPRRRTPPRDALAFAPLRAAAAVVAAAAAEDAVDALFCEGEGLGAGVHAIKSRVAAAAAAASPREALKLMQELEESGDEVSVSQAGDQFVPLRVRRADGGARPLSGGSGGGGGARRHANNEPSGPRDAPPGAKDSQNIDGRYLSKKSKGRNDKAGRKENVRERAEDSVIAGPSSARVESQERVGARLPALGSNKDRKARGSKKKVETERETKDDEEEEEEEEECARKPEREMQRLSKWLKALVRRTAHRHVSMRMRDCLRSWLEVYLRGETLLPSSADGPDDVFEVAPEVISELLRRARRPVVPVIHTDASISVSNSTAPTDDDDLDEETADEDDEEYMYSRVLDLLQPIGTPQDTVEDREALRELLHEFVDAQMHKRREAVKERRSFLHFLRGRGRVSLAERLQPRAEELCARVHDAVAEEAVQRTGYSLGEDRRRLREWVRSSAQAVLEQRLTPALGAAGPGALGAGARSEEAGARKHPAAVSTAPVAPPQRRALRDYLEQVVEREIRDETALREIQRKRLRVLLSMMKQQDLRSWLRALEMELKGQRHAADAESRDESPVRKTLRGGAHELQKWLKGSLYARVEMMIHEREMENAKRKEREEDVSGVNGTDVSNSVEAQEERKETYDNEINPTDVVQILKGGENIKEIIEKSEGKVICEATLAENKSQGEEGALLQNKEKINAVDEKHLEGEFVGDISAELIKGSEFLPGDTEKCIEVVLVGDIRMQSPERCTNTSEKTNDSTKQVELMLKEQGRELEKNGVIKAKEEKCSEENSEIDGSGEVTLTYLKSTENQKSAETILTTVALSESECVKIKSQEQIRFDETSFPKATPPESARTTDGKERTIHPQKMETSNTENLLLSDAKTEKQEPSKNKDIMVTTFPAAEYSDEEKRAKSQSPLKAKPSNEGASIVEDAQINGMNTYEIIDNILQTMLCNVIEETNNQTKREMSSIIENIITNVTGSAEKSDKQESFTIINSIVQEIIENSVERNDKPESITIIKYILQDIIGNAIEKHNIQERAQKTSFITQDIVNEFVGNITERITKEEESSAIKGIVEEIIGNVIKKSEGHIRRLETTSIIKDILNDTVDNIAERQEPSSRVKGIVPEMVGNTIERQEQSHDSSAMGSFSQESERIMLKYFGGQESYEVMAGIEEGLLASVMEKIEIQKNNNEAYTIISDILHELITNVIQSVEFKRNKEGTIAVIEDIGREIVENAFDKLQGQTNEHETAAIIGSIVEEMVCSIKEKSENMTVPHEANTIIQSIMEEMIENVSEKFERKVSRSILSTSSTESEGEMVEKINDQIEKMMNSHVTQTLMEGVAQQMVGNAIEILETQETTNIIGEIMQEMLKNVIDRSGRSTAAVIETIMQETMKRVYEKIKDLECRDSRQIKEDNFEEAVMIQPENINRKTKSYTNESHCRTEGEHAFNLNVTREHGMSEALLHEYEVEREIPGDCELIEESPQKAHSTNEGTGAKMENVSSIPANEVCGTTIEKQRMEMVEEEKRSGNSPLNTLIAVQETETCDETPIVLPVTYKPILKKEERCREDEGRMNQDFHEQHQETIASSTEGIYQKETKMSTDSPPDETKNRDRERKMQDLTKDGRNEKNKGEMEGNCKSINQEKDDCITSNSGEEATYISDTTHLKKKSLSKATKVEKSVHFEEDVENNKKNSQRMELSIDHQMESCNKDEQKETRICIYAPLSRKESIHVIKRAAETKNSPQNDDNSGRDDPVFSETESVTYESEYDSLEIGRSITEISGQDTTNKAGKVTETENVDPREQEERSRRLREQEEEIMAKLYKAWAHDSTSMKSLSEPRDDPVRGRAPRVSEMVSEGLETGDRRDHEDDYCLWPGGIEETVDEQERHGAATSEEEDIGANSRQFLHEEIDVELFEQYQADDDAHRVQVPVTAVTCPDVHPGGEDIHEDAAEMRDWLEEYIHATVAARMEAGAGPGPSCERALPAAGARPERQFLAERHGAFAECSRRGGRAHAPDGPDAHSTTCVCGSDVALWSLDEGEDPGPTPCAPRPSGASLAETPSASAGGPGNAVGGGGGGGEAPTGEELLLQRFLQDAAARAGVSESREAMLGCLRRFVVEVVDRVVENHRRSGSSSTSDLATARPAHRLSRTWSLGRCSDPSRERLCAALKEQAKSDLREWLSACVEQGLDERLGASSVCDDSAANSEPCGAPGSGAEVVRAGSVPVVQLATFECTSNMSLQESSRTSRAALEEDQDNSERETKPLASDVSDNAPYISGPPAPANDGSGSGQRYVPYFSFTKSPATVNGLDTSTFDSTLTSESSPAPSIGQEQDVLDLYERNCSPRNVLESLLCAYRDMLSQRLSELLGAIGHESMSPGDSLVSARGDALPLQEGPEQRRQEDGESPCGGLASPSPPGSRSGSAAAGPARPSPPPRPEAAPPFPCEGNLGDEDFKKEQEFLHADLAVERRREHGDAEAVDSPPEPPGPPSEKSTETLLEPRGGTSLGPLGVIPRSPSLIGNSGCASWDASAPREVTALSPRRHGSGRPRTSSALKAARSALESMISAAVKEDVHAVPFTRDPNQASESDSLSQNERQMSRGSNSLGHDHLSFTVCRVLSSVGSVVSATATNPSDFNTSDSSFSTISTSYTMGLPIASVSSAMGRLPSATSRTPSTVGRVLPGSPFPTSYSTSPTENENLSDASDEQIITPFSLHDLLEAGRLSPQPFHLSLPVASEENELRPLTESRVPSEQESPGQQERPRSEPITLDIRVSWVTMNTPFDGNDSSDDVHASCGFHDSDVCMLERLSYMHSEDCEDNTHLYNLFDDKQVQVLDFNLDEGSSTVSERGVIHWSNIEDQTQTTEECLRSVDGCVLALPTSRSSEESEDDDVTDLPITVATSSVDELIPTRIHEGTIVVDDFSGIMVPGMQGYWFGENGRLAAQVQGNSNPVPLHDIVDDVTKPERPNSGESSCTSGHIQCISGCGCPGDLDSISEWSRPESRDSSYTNPPSDAPVNVPRTLSSLATDAAARTPTSTDTGESPAASASPAAAPTPTEPEDATQASTSEGRAQPAIDPQDEEMHLAMALRQQEQHDSTRVRAPVTTAASRAARVRPESQAQLQAQPSPLSAPAAGPDAPSKSWDSDQFDVESKAESDEEDEDEKDLETHASKEKVPLAANENGRVKSGDRMISPGCIIAAARVQSFHDISTTFPLIKTEGRKEDTQEANSSVQHATENVSDTNHLIFNTDENRVTTIETVPPNLNSNEQSTQGITETSIANANEGIASEQLAEVDERTPEICKGTAGLDVSSQRGDVEQTNATNNLFENDLDLVPSRESPGNAAHFNRQIYEDLDITPCREPQEQPERNVIQESTSVESKESSDDEQSSHGQEDANETHGSMKTVSEHDSDHLDLLETTNDNENTSNKIQTAFPTFPKVYANSSANIFIVQGSESEGQMNSDSTGSDESVSVSQMQIDRCRFSNRRTIDNSESDILSTSVSSLSQEEKAEVCIESQQCNPAVTECRNEEEGIDVGTASRSGKFSLNNSKNEVEIERNQQIVTAVSGTESNFGTNLVINDVNTSATNSMEVSTVIEEVKLDISTVKAEKSEFSDGKNIKLNEKMLVRNVTEVIKDENVDDVSKSSMLNSEVEVTIYEVDETNATGILEGDSSQQVAIAITPAKEVPTKSSDINLNDGMNDPCGTQTTDNTEQKKNQVTGADEEPNFISELAKQVAAASEVTENGWNDVTAVNHVKEISTLSVYRTPSSKVVKDLNEVICALQRAAQHSMDDLEEGSPAGSQSAIVSKERGSNESLPRSSAVPSPVAGPSGYAQPLGGGAGAFAQRPSATDSSSGEDEDPCGGAARLRARGALDDSAQCAEAVGESARYAASYVRHFTCSPRPAEWSSRRRLGPLPDDDAEDESGPASRTWTDDELDDALRPAYLPPKPISALVSETDSDVDVASVASAPPGALLSRPHSAAHPRSDLSEEDSRRPSWTDAFRPTSAAVSDPGPWFPPNLHPGATRDAVSTTLVRTDALAKDKRKKDDKKKLGMKARVRSFFASAFGLNKKNPHPT